MSFAENPEEWHHLNALYSQKSDDELLRLHTIFDDLTEDAQNILCSELNRRKLSSRSQDREEPTQEPPYEPGDPTPEISVDAYNDHELLQMGGVVLAECETTEQADLICFALDHEAIKNAVRRSLGISDLRWPQVLVAPDDLEKARASLRKGISREIREEFEALPTELDYLNPACPHCGSIDALLESVEPVNEWLCGDCHTRWQETQ